VILSNLEIQKAIDDKRLIIEPEPIPRKLTPGTPYCPYNSTSVDLRLHNEISVPKPGTFAYDLTEPGAISEHIAKNSDKIVLRRDLPYKLETGKFILGWTLETIELCTTNGPPFLAARIEGKSSRARCGVLVHFTAPTVHAGWKGRLTLEMINLGPAPFLLTPGMPIAQLILEEVKGGIELMPSQFQNQSSPEGLVGKAQ
jgi:dCTP deaminase